MREWANTRLPFVEVEDGATTMHIRFNEEMETRNEEDGNTVDLFSYDHIRVSKNATRAEIIEAIIRYRYSKDRMEAIVNNYLNTVHSQEDVEAFEEMQEWRTAAKTIASDVLEALKQGAKMNE